MNLPALPTKIILRIAVFSFLSFFLLNPCPAFSAPSDQNAPADILTQLGDAMSKVAEKVKPAVVNISTSKTVKSPRLPFNDPMLRKYFGEDQTQKQKVFSLGSGVIATPDGYIVTCNHVIEGAEDIVVRLNDGRVMKGKIVGLDSRTDIAIIKINAENLPTITWGDSDRLMTGSVVIAIGNPYGLNQTVTMGIVSATGRSGIGLVDYEDFIQTDAAINPGNSGGALANSKGELVGINDAIFSTTGGYQGIGFAIPSGMARNIMNSIISQGKVVRGYLGVQVQPLTPELSRQFGLKDEKGILVVDVTEGSPADKGGLRRGDIIVGFDGKTADNPFQLKNLVASTAPGKKVDVRAIREGGVVVLSLVITELVPESTTAPAAETDNSLRGVTVQDLTAEIPKQLGVTRDIQGAVVSSVGEESRALGVLKRGDIIMEVNRTSIHNADEFRYVASKISPKDPILLLIMRGGVAQYLTLSGR
ncbi:MAG TPA: DegQ family serine endoprotease [Dissulfurispiraceae bacterium]|nr:DegQ family serine endoprotease [Dissulfurispiraceae bacterium]